MAVYRNIHISYWQDDFVLNLTPEEKFFYIYLMTNSKTKQCGIYELTKKVMCFETGYNIETIDKLIDRFVYYDKIFYDNDTNEIMILNWLKHNKPSNENIRKCILKELSEVKSTLILNKFVGIYSEKTGTEISPLQAACKPLPSKKNKNKNKNNNNNKEKNTPEIKISGDKKPNYIQTLYNIFTELYLNSRGYDFETDTIKKEESAIGKLAQGYKQRNPGKTTEDAIVFFTDFFKKCLQIEHEFLKRSMSPSLILNQKTQINTIIKEGDYANTTNIGNNQTNQYRNLPGGRVTASFSPEDYKGGWDG